MSYLTVNLPVSVVVRLNTGTVHCPSEQLRTGGLHYSLSQIVTHAKIKLRVPQAVIQIENIYKSLANL